MIAWVARLASGIWIKVAGAAVALGLLVTVYLSIRKSGRDAERAAAQARVLRNVEKRNEVDRTVAREPDPAGRLRDKWSRD
jgi:hypothetical protein